MKISRLSSGRGKSTFPSHFGSSLTSYFKVPTPKQSEICTEHMIRPGKLEACIRKIVTRIGPFWLWCLLSSYFLNFYFFSSRFSGFFYLHLKRPNLGRFFHAGGPWGGTPGRSATPSVPKENLRKSKKYGSILDLQPPTSWIVLAPRNTLGVPPHGPPAWKNIPGFEGFRCR